MIEFCLSCKNSCWAPLATAPIVVGAILWCRCCRRRFCHAILRLCSAIRWYHPPQRAVLSQICCFREHKVVLFPILLDGAEPRDAGTTWLCSPVLLAFVLSSMHIICPNRVSRRDWIIAAWCRWWKTVVAKLIATAAAAASRSICSRSIITKSDGKFYESTDTDSFPSVKWRAPATAFVFFDFFFAFLAPRSLVLYCDPQPPAAVQHSTTCTDTPNKSSTHFSDPQSHYNIDSKPVWLSAYIN